MRVLAVACIVAALAGCSDGANPTPIDPEVAHIRFDQVMRVVTVPSEPLEQVGLIRIAWTGDFFAIYNERESDLEHRTLVGDRIYTSNTGMGWLERSDNELGGVLSNRLILFDLRTLMASPGLDVSSTQNKTDAGLTDVMAKGVASPGVLNMPFTAHLTVRGDSIVYARVESPDHGREQPYRFHPASEPLGFDVVRPTAVLSRDKAIEGNGKAQPSHVLIKGLIDDYQRNHAGTLPERLDPQTLSLEMTAKGVSWPTGPFDGQAMADKDASGHFDWKRCTLTTGLYQGFGWDGAILVQPYGRCQ